MSPVTTSEPASGVASTGGATVTIQILENVTNNGHNDNNHDDVSKTASSSKITSSSTVSTGKQA